MGCETGFPEIQFRSMGEIMNILYTTNKGSFMDTIERFHVYSETQINNQINDKNTVKPNAIFDIINSHDPPRTPSSSHAQDPLLHSRFPPPAATHRTLLLRNYHKASLLTTELS